MNEPSDSQKIKDLSEKINSLILGYKVWGLSLFLLISALNFATTFSIPKFGQIFKDALGPDHPLPILTEFLLHFTTLVMGLAVLWPILGIVAVLRFKKISHVTIMLSFLLIVVIIQVILTSFGLYMPMVSTTDGMAPSP